MAVPIFVWNGTAWEATGPTIPASPIKYQASAPTSPSTGDIWVDSDADVTSGSQQFQRFRFVASGGETTISGNDANGATLAYTAGAELVVLNGSTLVRGQDYTATNGTTISGLSPALVANDVLEVFSFIAFSVANTYTQSQVDGLINAAPGMKLIVPTSADNGTVGATGAVTFSGASSVSVNDVFSATYDNYAILLNIDDCSAAAVSTFLRLRISGTDNSSNNYYWCLAFVPFSGTATVTGVNGNGLTNKFNIGYTNSGSGGSSYVYLSNPFRNFKTRYFAPMGGNAAADATLTRSGETSVTTSYTGFTILPDSGTFTGTVRVYGYKN